MNVDVGSFTKTSTTTGNQDITIARDLTAAGAGTWAIMFWTAGSDQASGTWDAGIAACLGFTTGAANSYAVAASSEDNVAASNTGRGTAAKCLTFVDAGFQLRAEADFVSFPSATSMRINWTTNANDALFNTIVINYVIFSGLTGAKVLDWTQPATAIDKAVTGAGFSPDLVFHATNVSTASVPNSAATTYFGVGAMNKHGQQWTNSIVMQDAVNPSNTSRWQQTDACLASVGPGESTNLAEAHFKSMDADGFTVNFSVSNTTYHIISLCLDGVSSKLGAFVGAASPQTVDTRQGFTAKGALFSKMGAAPTGAPMAHAIWSLGAFDGVNNRSAALVDLDAVTPTLTESAGYTDASITEGNFAAGTAVKGTLAFTSTTQSTVTWAVAATGKEILYLLIGDTGTDSFPAKVAM